MKDRIKKMLLAIQLAIIYSIIPVPLHAAKVDLPGLKKLGISNVTDFWNKLLEMIKICVMGFSGILTVLLVGVFAYKCFNLAASSNNPKQRAEAIKDILFTLIGIGLFGGTTLITGVAFNLLK